MAFHLLSRSKSVGRRSSKYLEEALYERLFKDGGSEVSVRRQLNEFLKSRKRVFKWEVDLTLRKLRDRRLYLPALKVLFFLPPFRRFQCLEIQNETLLANCWICRKSCIYTYIFVEFMRCVLVLYLIIAHITASYAMSFYDKFPCQRQNLTFVCFFVLNFF